MSTISDRRPADSRGSGGKILRTRRPPPSSRAPYSRPEKLPEREREGAPIEDDQANPNWLSGLIYPAKIIANGAGKILSFFGNESDYSSSDSDASENDDEEDEMVENDTSFKLDDQSLKVLSKSEKKRAIGQLVMQETFSREEGSELIKLIKSRIVDANGNPDESAANMRTTAIMEARKWLQQKRSGSKNKLENELDATNFAMTSQVSRNETGSPVDMAKSYMQNRPAWASPTLNNSGFRSPPPLGALHFKEETPTSTLRSYEMKRSSLSSGSWNIFEEIRRVRSKATEELLAATPLTKSRISSFSPESNPPQQHSIDLLRGGPADSTHDGPRNVLADASTSLPSRINQGGGDAVQSIGLQESHQDADKSNKDEELNEMRISATGNGSPSNVSSMAAGQDATQNPSPSKDENGTMAASSQAGSDVHMGDPHPPDDVVNGSQNSSSIEPEDPSQVASQPIEKQPSTTTVTKDSLRGKRSTTRRGKARAK